MRENTVSGAAQSSRRGGLRLLIVFLAALSLLLFLPRPASTALAADKQLKVKQTGFTVYESADMKDFYVVTMVAEVTNPNAGKTVLYPNGTFSLKTKSGKKIMDVPAAHSHIAPKDSLYFFQTAMVPKKEGKPAKVTFALEKSGKSSFSPYVSERDWRSTDFKISGLKLVKNGNAAYFEGTVRTSRPTSDYIPVVIVLRKGGRLKGQVVGFASKESGEFHIPYPAELQKKLGGAKAKAVAIPDNPEIFD